MKQFCVYILASKKNGTLYVGVTSNLARRIYEHREGLYDGFTKQYSIKRLVWYEMHDRAETAFQREKNIKEWKRKWKISLIEEMNPDWFDLYLQLNGSFTEWIPAFARMTDGNKGKKNRAQRGRVRLHPGRSGRPSGAYEQRELA